ncbi:MAG: hypothetical protein EU548_07770 [Promethearchaeota archaeon]|nr:MAG: hypothetical protein EU548_07770 [Candidatus Lokiarchaeota archaeon]
MKFRFISIGLLLILAFFPVKFSLAYQYVDNVNEGISTFFLTSLQEGENLEVEITHTGSGNFTLFLFDQRPIYSHLNVDKSLDSDIFTMAINFSLVDNPYINYSVLETDIYYIQVILLDNGPDTFFLESNHELTRYYIPAVPGYQLPLIIFSLIAIIVLLTMIYRKRVKR